MLWLRWHGQLRGRIKWLILLSHEKYKYIECKEESLLIFLFHLSRFFTVRWKDWTLRWLFVLRAWQVVPLKMCLSVFNVSSPLTSVCTLITLVRYTWFITIAMYCHSCVHVSVSWMWVSRAWSFFFSSSQVSTAVKGESELTWCMDDWKEW